VRVGGSSLGSSLGSKQGSKMGSKNGVKTGVENGVKTGGQKVTKTGGQNGVKTGGKSGQNGVIPGIGYLGGTYNPGKASSGQEFCYILGVYILV